LATSEEQVSVISRVNKLWRWICERFKDLFYATGNENLELGRTVTGILTSLIVFAVYWNAVRLEQAIDLNGFLVGLAAFVTASGLGIAAKDWVRNKLTKDIANTAAAVKLAENVNTAAVLLAENVEERKDAE
jgi:hypothetical protein